MKAGSDLFVGVVTPEGMVLAEVIAAMKGRELLALLDHAQQRAECQVRDEVIGTVIVYASQRYFARVRAKAARRRKKARKIL